MEEPKNQLLTADPVALGYLMSETLFSITPDEARAPVAAVSGTQEASPEPVGQVKIPFLGENRSAYLFIVEEREHEWLPAPAMDAFSKSLTALQLSMNNIALVNLGRIGEGSPDQAVEPGQLLRWLLDQFNPSRVVLLGVQPGRFGFPEHAFTAHQPARLQEVNWLYTYSFSEMLSDVDKKRIFWTSIKTFF